MRFILFFIIAIALINEKAFSQAKKNSLIYSEGYINVGNGVSVFYQKVGNGKQKIIVPLGFWLYDDFKHLADSADRTIVFFDQRNRARSSYIADTNLIDIRLEIEDIEKVRQHFNFPKVSLIGESYLGFLVMLYTKKYPQHVDRIVQIGAVPAKWDTQYPDSIKFVEDLPESKIIRSMLYALEDSGFAKQNPMEYSRILYETVNKRRLLGDQKKVFKMGPQWGNHLQYSNEWAINFSRHLKYSFKTIQALNAKFEDFKNIQQPVLTIHGTKDQNAPFGSGKQWANTLPNAKLLRVNGAAHIPWVEEPQLVFSSINIFLKGKWPRSVVKL